MPGTESDQKIQGREDNKKKEVGSPQTTVAAGSNGSAGSSATANVRYISGRNNNCSINLD